MSINQISFLECANKRRRPNATGCDLRHAHLIFPARRLVAIKLLPVRFKGDRKARLKPIHRPRGRMR